LKLLLTPQVGLFASVGRSICGDLALPYFGIALFELIRLKEIKMKKNKRFPWLRILVHVIGILPLFYLTYAFFANKLTINPIQTLEQTLGRIAIYWMVATLAVTPLYTITGYRDLPGRRRAVGLYAFLYTCLHLLIFFGLDYAFNLLQIWKLVTGKVYLLVGVVAVLLLIPLAVTSFDYFIRVMGKNWKRLHWLVYPAVVASILHYGLAQKGDLFTLRGNELRPFLWGLLTFLLLAFRIPPVRRWVSAKRRQLFVRFRHVPSGDKAQAG
jgi:methionine sulfoxide reductase heme-binding subunit